jgi:hypothetical protein
MILIIFLLFLFSAKKLGHKKISKIILDKKNAFMDNRNHEEVTLTQFRQWGYWCCQTDFR